jgi:hypothetical protein
MAHLLDNKWRHGMTKFDFSKVTPSLLARDGTVPVQVVLIGSTRSKRLEWQVRRSSQRAVSCHGAPLADSCNYGYTPAHGKTHYA